MHNTEVITNNVNDDISVDAEFDGSSFNHVSTRTFCKDKICDSGINSLPHEDGDRNVDNKNTTHSYDTITLPVSQNQKTSAEKTWNSLYVRNKDVPGARNSIIELKTTDRNNHRSTSIVVFRNRNREFRKINIIDYRQRQISKGHALSSSSVELNYEAEYTPDSERSLSSIDIAQIDPSVDRLSDCHGKRYSSSETSINLPAMDTCSKSLTKKSSLKILKEIASTLCCRNFRYSSETSEDETESNTCYPNWKFDLDEFDDLTYLSSGAQGTIFTAKFRGTIVAMKRVKNSRNSKEVNIEHLLDLHHKNVITFIGISEEIDTFLVMEYCSRGQLFDWLHRDVEITPKDIRFWAYQICDGMTYLHKKNIIHRDLKSPNILLAEDNVLKIIDFEFSKDLCESKILNSFVGTIAWMAPEVLREELHTQKVDVWSYGVVIWEMLTREIPYGGLEAMSILYGVGNNCLSLPLCKSIPTEIKDLLSKCWEKKSERRPSFQDIMDNFKDYFDNLEHFSTDTFSAMQLEWKKEIEVHFQETNKATISASVVEIELIRRRTQELNDAKIFKELYSEKLRRADKLIALLDKCLNVVEDERKKNEREWKLIQKIKSTPYQPKKDNHTQFSSLPFEKGVKNILFPSETCHKTVSKKCHLSKRDSILEHDRLQIKTNTVRRKLSVNSFKDGNNAHSRKKKINSDENNRTRKMTKTPSKSNHNVEMGVKDKFASLSSVNVIKSKESKRKRDLSPCPNSKFSTLPIPNKNSLNGCNVAGIVNPSFQGSLDSGMNLKDFTNSNLVHIAYFGTRASITDINNPTGITSDEDNMNPITFFPSLLEQPISEEYLCSETSKEYSTQNGNHVILREVSGRSKASSNDNLILDSLDTSGIDTHQETSLGNPIMIRDVLGRRKTSSNDNLTHDSMDTSTLNAHIQTPFSIIEKEAIVEGLIRPHDFLARVTMDSSIDVGASNVTNYDMDVREHLK